MKNHPSVNERFDALIEHFAKGNKTAFAKEVGTLPSVIASIVGGRMSKPSFELLEKIAVRYPEINTTWLLTGKGDMVIPEAPDRVQLPPTKPAVLFGKSSFLPSDYIDPLAEYYEQRKVDFKYLIELADFITKEYPLPKVLQFYDRLPYTINPDYDPEETDPSESGNEGV